MAKSKLSTAQRLDRINGRLVKLEARRVTVLQKIKKGQLLAAKLQAKLEKENAVKAVEAPVTEAAAASV